MSTEPLEGELVRHQNKSISQIYRQSTSQYRFVWSGCLAPILVIALFCYLIYQGATSSVGIELIRGFIIFIVIFLLLQLFIGGGLFKKSPSGLKMTILANLGVILLLLMLALIGLASVIQNVLT